MTMIVAIVIVPLSIIQMKTRVFRLALSDAEKRVNSWTAPYRTVNSYGLFADMTESRPEIIVEGSNDRQDWQAYEFRWKPGDLQRQPQQVAPHQPRIDWQMWFEALNYLRDGKPKLWFRSFLIKLLEGNEDVLKLLEYNPFPDSPPKYVRAVVYDYDFTDWKERAETGNWWKTDYKGIYVYPSSLPQDNEVKNK